MKPMSKTQKNATSQSIRVLDARESIDATGREVNHSMTHGCGTSAQGVTGRRDGHF